MSLYHICLIITIVVAILLVVFQVAAMYGKISAWCCIVSFVLFIVMVFVTSYFKEQQYPYCTVCETHVETNYCPGCGTDMRVEERSNV